MKYLHCQSIQRTSFLANNVSKQCVWGVDVGVPHQVLSDGDTYRSRISLVVRGDHEGFEVNLLQ